MAVAEIEEVKKFTTGNDVLDFELRFLTEENLTKLADYAKYLVWSQNDEDDGWADAPLTEDEKKQIEESRRDFEKGEYLTLEELVEGL